VIVDSGQVTSCESSESPESGSTIFVDYFTIVFISEMLNIDFPVWKFTGGLTKMTSEVAGHVPRRGTPHIKRTVAPILPTVLRNS
jgi:hypothetical protein